MRPLKAKLQQITNQPVYKGLFYILSVAFAGILGNRADALFIYLIQQIRPGFFPSGIWSLFSPLVVALPVAIVFAAITALPLTFIIIRLQRAKRKSEGLLEIDESVFRILKLSGYGKEQQEAFASLIDTLLKEALSLFGNDCEISVYRVDNPSKPKIAYLWCAKGLQSFTPTSQRLLALDKKPIKKNNLTTAMKRSYIDGKVYIHEDTKSNDKNEDGSKSTKSAGSLISCPIFEYRPKQNSDKPAILGVLTVVSRHRNAFKNSGVEAAQKIADRLASVMLIATRY